MPSKTITLYDTTLRDGTQAEDINFTVASKIQIASKLADFGISYIEGGWPGSNPRDIEFFKVAHKKSFFDKVTAFGSTRRASKSCEKDANLNAILDVGVRNAAIFGKSWDFHVEHALGISLEVNLEMIYDSISYLKKHLDYVFYDAEHFFDGYKNNPEYALQTISAAAEAGSDCLVLCDTNGGCLPHEIEEIVSVVKKHAGTTEIGIHCHNDGELAVANTISAVRMGATHIQGTINGYGERCGNANLCSIIPNLQLKLGIDCVDDEKLKQLRILSRYVNEMGNLKHNIHQPYVGRSAFAHKGGIHVSAVMKNSTCYEHIDPSIVGNIQRVLISDLSGRSNLVYKARDMGLDVDDTSPVIQGLLVRLKELENKGFQYEGAEASFELLIRHAMNVLPNFFDIISFRVIDEKRDTGSIISEATIMVSVNGDIEHTASIGNGPVNALDKALRKALLKFYPNLSEMELLDYKVRILNGEDGTEAITRVLIESKDEESSWGTVGVAPNIIDASYEALTDSIKYKLLKDMINGDD